MVCACCVLLRLTPPFFVDPSAHTCGPSVVTSRCSIDASHRLTKDDTLKPTEEDPWTDEKEDATDGVAAETGSAAIAAASGVRIAAR